MAKTLSSQGRYPGFNSWSGNQIPHATTKTQSSRINFKNIKKELWAETSSLLKGGNSKCESSTGDLWLPT